MNRSDLQAALDFIFSHPVMKRRKENSIKALRRRNMDAETRGVVLGHLDILDYMESSQSLDLAPNQPRPRTLLDDLFYVNPEDQDQDQDGSLRAAGGPERVAPLPSDITRYS